MTCRASRGLEEETLLMGGLRKPRLKVILYAREREAPDEVGGEGEAGGGGLVQTPHQARLLTPPSHDKFSTFSVHHQQCRKTPTVMYVE